MLVKIKGNLIDLAEQGHFDVIIHGCNCQNTMGSGIAKEIRERYPIAYRADTEYNNFCASSTMAISLLGNYSVATGVGSPKYGHRFAIVNAYTQIHYLPRGVDHFEYESFSLILRKLSVIYPGKHFGLPMIGMGLAGGNSHRIIPIIEKFEEDVSLTGGSVKLVEFG